MTETEFNVGDKVRLVIEGTVTYRYPEGDKGISIKSDEPYIYGYDEDEDIITVGHGDVLKGNVELVKRAPEVFPPGAVVQSIAVPSCVFTILPNGWFDHLNNKANLAYDDTPFTSDDYERLA